ncbi:MAG: imidazole glycerol phosphate synthase subunit HisH [Cytophagaceae bacterium]
MIVIVDYGLGNPTSIKNMLRKCEANDVVISSSLEDINNASKLILPGVGNFDYGMQRLKEYALIETLNKRVLDEKIPLLGICLGAQLLTKHSEEGNVEGLAWIPAETRKFRLLNNFKVPHMGWNEVFPTKGSRLLENMPDEMRFYFVHSYHIVCEDAKDQLLESDYGYRFTAAVEKDNIAGVQFHPEKSHKFGMRFLYNFVKNF